MAKLQPYVWVPEHLLTDLVQIEYKYDNNGRTHEKGDWMDLVLFLGGENVVAINLIVIHVHQKLQEV